jgi:hypothetical protein
MSDEQNRLELRITELENQIKELLEARKSAEITPEEMETFRKVSKLIGIDPDNNCGINECDPCIILRCVNLCIRCITCVTCLPCDVECTCGPCNLQLRRGGATRFRNLG